jgi:predicted RNA binding protein YcfA (HicA-like mRNA interferase family)
VKIRDLITMVEADGWCHIATKGSHRQYKHPSKPGGLPCPVIRETRLRPALRRVS